MTDPHDSDNAATMFYRLLETVQIEYGLDDDQAITFIKEACKAGGMPCREDEPELVEQLRQVAVLPRTPGTGGLPF